MRTRITIRDGVTGQTLESGVLPQRSMPRMRNRPTPPDFPTPFSAAPSASPSASGRRTSPS